MTFSSKQSRWRHEKFRCKIRKKIEQEKMEIEAYHEKKTKRLNDEINRLEQKIININNNTYIENQQNNIIINNYGKENIEYITPAYNKKIYSTRSLCFNSKIIKINTFQ